MGARAWTSQSGAGDKIISSLPWHTSGISAARQAAPQRPWGFERRFWLKSPAAALHGVSKTLDLMPGCARGPIEAERASKTRSRLATATRKNVVLFSWNRSPTSRSPSRIAAIAW